MNEQDPHRPIRALSRLIMTACGLALLASGCVGSSDAPGPAGPSKVKVAYLGLTCEAPIFTAYEKGFFREENLDVSLVKCEWATYKATLALGGFDITHH